MRSPLPPHISFSLTTSPAAAALPPQEWQALCEKLLPPPAKEARSGRPELGERAREEAVDGALLLAQVSEGRREVTCACGCTAASAAWAQLAKSP